MSLTPPTFPLLRRVYNSFSAVVLQTGNMTIALNPAGVVIASEQAGSDDGGVIQAAIDYGGRIYIHDGTYYLSNSLTLSSDAHLCGAGPSTKLQLVSGSDCDMLYASSKSNILISDISLDGNKSGQTAGNGIYFTQVSNSIIARVVVSDTYGHGIALDNNSNYNIISFCESHDAGVTSGMGIGVYTGSSNNRITGCYSEGSVESNFRVWSSTSTLCNNNIFDSCVAYGAVSLDGFSPATGYRNLFANCIALNNNRAGFYGSQYGGTTAYGNVFANCLSYSNSYGFRSSVYCLFSNCYSVEDGTGFFSETNPVDMSSCIAYKSSTRGFDVRTSSALDGCRATDCGQGGGGATSQSGFYLPVDSVSLSDCVSKDDGGGTQKYGFYVTGNNCRLYNCTGSGNATEDFHITGSGLVAIDCVGYVTRNNGTATITSGNTSVVVNHGLATTPTTVVATPDSDTSFYITNKTSTQFTINIPASLGSDASFDWYAEV